MTGRSGSNEVMKSKKIKKQKKKIPYRTRREMPSMMLGETHQADSGLNKNVNSVQAPGRKRKE